MRIAADLLGGLAYAFKATKQAFKSKKKKFLGLSTHTFCCLHSIQAIRFCGACPSLSASCFMPETGLTENFPLTPFTACIGGGDGWPGSCCTLILGSIAACPCIFTGTGGDEEVSALGVEEAVVVFAGVVTLFGLNPGFILLLLFSKI